MAKLEIIIHEDGTVEIENTEIKGEGCTGIADILAQRVGEKKEQELKQEYYEVPLPDYEHVNEG